MNEREQFEQIVADLQPTAPEGYVEVDKAAIEAAIHYIRTKKEAAADIGDDVELARWRDEEKQMLASKALGGFVRIDES